MEMRVTPIYEEGSLALSSEPVCYSMLGCAHCGIFRCCLKVCFMWTWVSSSQYPNPILSVF